MSHDQAESTPPDLRPLARPELSLVLPCYNEASCLPRTVPPLAAAFSREGIELELVLVDNGSTDATSAVIDELIARGLPITKLTVPHNRGQGLGLRTGLEAGRGRVLGYLCADGQVAPADVVRVYRAARAADGPRLVKARRVGRSDGLVRRVVSAAYNALVRLLFPGCGTRDVNGNPKFLPAEVVRRMQLASDDWFLEAEIVLKARALGVPVEEVAVAGLAREGGRSHVRVAAIAEFLRNIAHFRCRGPWAPRGSPGQRPN